MEQEKTEIIPDMSAKEFFEGLLNLDFMTEEERETIYKATELYAKGKVRVASQPPLSSKELEEWINEEAEKHSPVVSAKLGFKSGCTAMQLHLQGEQSKCVMGCKHFTGGEIKHHKDCPYYPDSLSEQMDKQDAEIERLKGLGLEMFSAINQTLGQYSGEFPDEYEVSFLYPANNKAYQMLLKAWQDYKSENNL